MRNTTCGQRPRHFHRVGLALLGATALAISGPFDPAFADPPPWAPAHGYRAKGKKQKKKQRQVAYVAPFDLNVGRCNRTLLGAAIGGATGAAVGASAGKGDDRDTAIILGAVLGAVVGGVVGRAMDDLDQSCVGQALEHAGDGETIVWKNPDNGQDYRVTPTRTYQQTDGRYCREYQTQAVIAGKTQQVYGRACRQPDGSWQLIS